MQQQQGDKAGLLMVRLVCVQLVALTTLLCLLSFLPDLRDWAERMERDDVCLESTKVMTCLDWGLNVALFLVLLPIIFATVQVRAPIFRWTLWSLWSAVLVTDLAFFLAAFAWKKYAAASAVIMVAYTVLLSVVAHLPRSVLLLSWRQSYNYAVKVGLTAGVVLVLVTKDTSYGWVALITPLVICAILFCIQTVQDSCPCDQAMLGSMFVLFPEGLLFALWLLRRSAPSDSAGLGASDCQQNLGRQLLADEAQVAASAAVAAAVPPPPRAVSEGVAATV